MTIRTKTSAFAAVMALVAVATTAIAMLPSGAQEPPPAISSLELTTRSEFTDDLTTSIRLKPDGRPRQTINLRNPSKITVAQITVQPGARFPWHTHPGPVLASVKQGELVYVYGDDCVQRPYPAGTAFIDPGGTNVHYAFNPNQTGEAVVLATFLDAPETGPLTLPVPTEEAAALDDKCDVAPATHSH